MEQQEARSRVLAAAEELYYGRGIHAVGIDEVRDRAGVSLAKLYKLFPSKQHLVAAYLTARGRRLRAELAEYVDRAAPAPATSTARLLAVFGHLRETIDAPEHRGCAFTNAWVEAGAHCGPADALVAEAVREHKRLLGDYLADLAADRTDPRGVAEQIQLLTEGAMVLSSIMGPDAARHARRAATAVLDADT
ncbi:TetR/AcrR family transcriptional regulator [Streptomyces sp. NBC_01429]|uniref:TetR/AcrR family transcriptional regulator n=1 Tax=Streptomyces sp. NBC_01429 TaxID=2903862 RepID=UPI002E296F7D|nr:TetR/AcrR family transcriptional regulator [Streptomyces sp. NBC_01429]